LAPARRAERSKSIRAAALLLECVRTGFAFLALRAFLALAANAYFRNTALTRV
jgi:hypothetical protein